MPVYKNFYGKRYQLSLNTGQKKDADAKASSLKRQGYIVHIEKYNRTKEETAFTNRVVLHSSFYSGPRKIMKSQGYNVWYRPADKGVQYRKREESLFY